MKDFGTMSDHDILVVIATKQSSMQDSIDQFHDSQAFFNAGIDARLRDVEKNGSKITRDNALAIANVSERVGKLEDFCISHETQVKETTRIATIIAGLISVGVAIATVGFSFWQWGKP